MLNTLLVNEHTDRPNLFLGSLNRAFARSPPAGHRAPNSRLQCCSHVTRDCSRRVPALVKVKPLPSLCITQIKQWIIKPHYLTSRTLTLRVLFCHAKITTSRYFAFFYSYTLRYVKAGVRACPTTTSHPGVPVPKQPA